MTPEEVAVVEALLLHFRWPDETQTRFEALRVLRWARGEVHPTWDDFAAGVQR